MEMHLDVERQALLENDVILGNALVEMYTKCGALGRAKQAFDKIRTPDMLSWTILIAGYIDGGHGEEAMKCFEQLRCKSISPNPVLLTYGIKACGMIGASGRAEEIHGEIRSQGLLKKDLVIGNTLLDMYARRGSLERAKEVFSELPVRDVVAWTSLMAGYTQVGETDNAFLLFEKMLGEGISPDTVSFLVILAACARKRLLDKSWTYFEAMSRCYGITPGPHHHACVLDVMGRCGHLDQALEMIKGSRLRSDVVLWRGILGSCRHWGNVNLGLESFEHAKQFK
jgi:pentatricopeptide repeat protein